MIDEADLSERLRALPGMDRVLPALDGLPPCFLVGGAVRDLLLGQDPVDIDIAVEGDAQTVAASLAQALGGEVAIHERFGTATVMAGGIDAVNLARTRRESYARPGALPDVEPATLTEDLGRRDFTINALAMGLDADRLGEIHDRHGGRGDLEAGRVRVLHDGSFVDDPTRLLRAVRYTARLGFELDRHTRDLAHEAASAGVFTTVSGSRVRDELLDLLAEPTAPDAVALLAELGIGEGLHPQLGIAADRVASAKLGAAETGADPVLAALASLCLNASDDLERWIDGLDLLAAARDATLRAARRAPTLAEELRGHLRPSQLHALLAPEPPEALALALALGAPAQPVLEFVSSLSGVRLEITGADLLAVGVPESPALGRALRSTLARKLDGELDGREQELSAALEEIAGAGA